MKLHREVLVMPTQGLRNGVAAMPERQLRRALLRGGPVWPRYHLQIRSRQCRGWLPVPLDRKPAGAAAASVRIAEGIWCGPVSPHYGHMIADFGMRIAASSRRAPDLPLLFSFWPDPEEQPPEFFWELLDHLRVARERVRLVREPTKVARLWAAPQAERLGGKGPSARHLDLMDEIVAAQGPAPRDIELLFVSRARLPDGRLAGEGYLDQVFAAAGAVVVHPETMPVARQVELYRRARRMVFTEGSALHSLQLLGRVEADVVVLVRRPGARIAAASLRPRVRSLAYLDIAAGAIQGLDRRGLPQADRALRLVDEGRAAGLLRRLGLDPARLWRSERYGEERQADIRRWIAYMAALDLHPRAFATIRESLARHGIDLDAAAAWAAGAGGSIPIA